MKEIKGYDYNYYIDEYGAMLRESKTGELLDLKSHIRKHNRVSYETVILVKDGKPKPRSVHRLLLQAFNPVANMNDLQVDHINRDSLDNRLYNLRWCTDLENQYNRPEHMQPKPVLFTNKLDNTEIEFQSLSKAAKEFSCNIDVIKRAIKGRSIKFKDWDVKFI